VLFEFFYGTFLFLLICLCKICFRDIFSFYNRCHNKLSIFFCHWLLDTFLQYVSDMAPSMVGVEDTGLQYRQMHGTSHLARSVGWQLLGAVIVIIHVYFRPQSIEQ